MKIVNNKIIDLSSKGKYIRLCQGDPIGAGIFVAITGPPEMKEIIEKVYQLSCFYKRCKGTLCKSTL